MQQKPMTTMKNALLTAATLVVLLSTSALAQRYGYPAPPPANYPSQPGYGQPNYNYDYDDYRFDRHLDWWDRELNLTRRQEREIRRIRERFEQQTRRVDPRDPRQRDTYRQLRQREFFDMMAVLGPEQRDRVIERMRPYERSANRWPDRRNSRGRGYEPYGY